MIRKGFSAAALICLTGLLTITSCKKSDDISREIQLQVQTNVQSGTWRITKFIDSGNDETNNFLGYNFSFNNSGVLIANNGTNNYTGVWSVIDESNDDDNGMDDLDFNIYFNLTNDFEDLNDDWDFVSQSATKIELVDVSSGNGGTDYLTFEKN